MIEQGVWLRREDVQGADEMVAAGGLTLGWALLWQGHRKCGAEEGRASGTQSQAPSGWEKLGLYPHLREGFTVC